jgi:hypothetical protein
MSTAEEVLNSRFDRVEAKLDKVADALTTLARVEERQAFTHATLERFGGLIDDHEDRITTLERSGDVSKVKIGFGERVWWLLLAAIIGGIGILWK